MMKLILLKMTIESVTNWNDGTDETNFYNYFSTIQSKEMST